MFVLMVAGAVAVPYLKEGEQALQPLYLIFAGCLALGATLFVCGFEARACESYLFWLIPLVYLISVAFLLLFDNPFTFPFWTFGGLLLLCSFRLRYGMLLNVFQLFILGSLQEELFSEVLFVQLLCLLLLGFIMPYAKTIKDGVNILISVAAVLICVRIVCYFTMDRTSLTNDIFSVAVVYVIVICAVLLLSKVFRETAYMQRQEESFVFLEELAAGAELQDADVALFNYSMTDVDDSEKTEALAQETAPLLEQLSRLYPKAFLHARRVALLAEEVAERLEGVNPLLVKCGGYYHEIGRLRGGKSLANTLAVAEEEAFPAALQAILREHTTEGDRPASKEAALLLLTDNICGVCEHLKKTQTGKILVVKVIEKAINLRLSKGDFDLSGLTAADLSVIRNTMTEIIKEDMF